MNSLIKIERVGDHDLPNPSQATRTSAGYDLCSTYDKVEIGAGKQLVIPTGFIWEIPEFCAGFIWPRSGLAVKKNIHVMAGLIDSDYRGEIMVCLRNLGDRTFRCNFGDKIAQLVISPVLHKQTACVISLGETVRGSGGFGSTGR